VRMTHIKPGEQVEWLSRRVVGGVYQPIRGIVLGFVGVNEDAFRFIPDSALPSHIRFDGPYSLIERYVIAVQDETRTRYYSPQAGMIERANPDKPRVSLEPPAAR
jgi:hypothetical protein